MVLLVVFIQRDCHFKNNVGDRMGRNDPSLESTFYGKKIECDVHLMNRSNVLDRKLNSLSKCT